MSTYCNICRKQPDPDTNTSKETFAVCNVCGNAVCDDHHDRCTLGMRVICEECLPNTTSQSLASASCNTSSINRRSKEKKISATNLELRTIVNAFNEEPLEKVVQAKWDTYLKEHHSVLQFLDDILVEALNVVNSALYRAEQERISTQD